MSETQKAAAPAAAPAAKPVVLPALPSIEEMLAAGVHFGHRTSKWYPKMKQYIFGIRNGVHIMDLEQTVVQLKKAVERIAAISAQGGTVLFVGTKKQAKAAVRAAAEVAGTPHVTERWLGGTFTNFNQINKLAKRYRQLKDLPQSAEWEKYTKKEQALFAEEIQYLEKKVGGILNMDRLPQAIFVVGVREEETAVREANAMGIPVIAFGDSNVNPAGIDLVIPANDDAVRSIQIVTQAIAEAIRANKK